MPRKTGQGISASQEIPRQSSQRPRRKTNYSQPNPSSLSDSDTEENTRRVPKQNFDAVVAEEINHQTEILIKYLFGLIRSKQSITKARILKHVLGGHGKLFRHVLKKAKDTLSKVFGFKLETCSNDRYILVNELVNKTPHIVLSENQAAQQTLLFLVLTHIFMSGESTTEEVLWGFLKEMNIERKDNSHYYFGNVEEIIRKDFIRQNYLEICETGDNDSSTIEYQWGSRAEHEFTRRGVLEFVSMLYNCPISDWVAQYKLVKTDELLDQE